MEEYVRKVLQLEDVLTETQPEVQSEVVLPTQVQDVVSSLSYTGPTRWRVRSTTVPLPHPEWKGVLVGTRSFPTTSAPPLFPQGSGPWGPDPDRRTTLS